MTIALENKKSKRESQKHENEQGTWYGDWSGPLLDICMYTPITKIDPNTSHAYLMHVRSTIQHWMHGIPGNLQAVLLLAARTQTTTNNIGQHVTCR
jgi:hypothetical protein